MNLITTPKNLTLSKEVQMIAQTYQTLVLTHKTVNSKKTTYSTTKLAHPHEACNLLRGQERNMTQAIIDLIHQDLK